MVVCNRHRCLLAIAAALAVPALAHAQPYTLQRSNSIDLTGFFFGGGTSAFGVSPIGVAYDGTTAWVGGYNNSGTFGSIGVVRVGDPLSAAPAAAGLAGAGGTFNSSAFRGFSQMAALNGEVYLGYANNEGIEPFIRKINGTTGDQVWQTQGAALAGGYQPFAIAIDPRGGVPDGGGVAGPGLRVMSQDPFVSGGNMAGLQLSDGAVVYGVGSVIGQGAAGVFQTAGQNTGFSNRDLSFDDNGNLMLSTGQGYSVANRAGNNSFAQFNVAAPGAGSTGTLRKNEAVLNGEGIAGVHIPTIGGGTATLMANAMRAPSDALSFTSQDGTTQIGLDARNVHLHNLNGTVTGNPQASLSGDEDFFTTAYSGQVKDMAVGRDANGNPVLMVLSFADRRLDIYQVEPTFTAAGGAWETAGNWNLGLIGDGATQNARFTGAGGSVSLDSAKTTKLLKLGGTGAYTISGTGTLTTDAPDGRGAYIAVLAGSHTIAVPVVAAAGTDLRVPTGGGLTLSGGISGAGLTKRDLGEARVKNFNMSAVNVAEGVLSVLTNGTAAGASRAGDLAIANDGSGTFSAKLDLTNNGLVVASTPIADVEAALLSGRNGGNWNGQGLTSSTAAANSSVAAVGFAAAGDIGVTSFLGISVVATDTLVRYTRLGDANLSGTTDISDFSILGANFNSPGKWGKGDFNFDGNVDIGDFSILGANFNQTAPGDLPRGTAVPEPLGFGLIGVSLLGLRRRRD